MEKKDFNEKNVKVNKIDNFEFQTEYSCANIGNTCYMNSFLPILFHTPSFLTLLKKIKKKGI